MNKKSQSVAVIVVILIIVFAAILGLGYFYLYGGKQYSNPVNNPPSVITPKNTANQPASSAKTYAVDINNFAFVSASLTIKKGDSVIWTNSDSAPHTVTSDSGELDSPNLAKGQTYSHTFANAGTSNYYCTIHPAMKGKIIVQ